MAPTASIIVPTQDRPEYLEVALRSITPQATVAGAEVIVVDDGPSAATRAVAERHGARYVARTAPHGLNAARNAGVDAAASELLVFADDDVDVHPGWLDALITAHAVAGDDVGAFTGPITPRFEDHRFHTCGREGPPVTFLDLGRDDTDADHAWGANMTVRRATVERIGRFDEALNFGAGDEQEWQDRLRAAGLRIRYVAAAGLDHRRAGDDARLRSLVRSAFRRGRSTRRWDAWRGAAPTAATELRTLAGCLWHTVRRACWMNGPVMAAHSLGRLREALDPQPPPARPGVDDFLAGRSGHVAGRRATVLRAADVVLDLAATPTRHRLDRAAAAGPRRRVHVVAIDRPGSALGAALDELRRSRHDVRVHPGPLRQGVGKFARVAELLAEHPPGDADWLVVLDDDVVLPSGFLDRFVACAEAADLRLAQPAHRLHSHAAWPVTRRAVDPRSAVRETRFVEIGPITAFRADTLGVLLPFPELRMGWGLDVHWGAVAREHRWRVGVVDATPILHLAPVAADYDREGAAGEARAFLADRPYVTRGEAGWSRPLEVERSR
ncbi:glycosyltransferase [Svornostia abyssi]|uniref:Glycosyltransferase n=1 Tax=Svornostia abyssi TaxID=2898438 RepID=A0ABY5PHQ3_9ACTN|nr:glycosyltransferase [Parviterribacteraceae bacterium J379]